MPKTFKTIRINQNRYKIPVSKVKEVENNAFKCLQCSVSFAKDEDLEDHKNKVNHELITAYKESLKDPENKSGKIIVILNNDQKIEEIILRENQPRTECLKIFNKSENDYVVRKIATDRTSSFIEIESIPDAYFLLSKNMVEIKITLKCSIFITGIEINLQEKEGEDKFTVYKFLVI